MFAQWIDDTNCCTTCDCGRTFCRDLEPSPGEVDGTCPDCYERSVA